MYSSSELYIVSPTVYSILCQKVRGQFVVLSNISIDRITCNSGDVLDVINNIVQPVL